MAKSTNSKKASKRTRTSTKASKRPRTNPKADRIIIHGRRKLGAAKES